MHGKTARTRIWANQPQTRREAEPKKRIGYWGDVPAPVAVPPEVEPAAPQVVQGRKGTVLKTKRIPGKKGVRASRAAQQEGLEDEKDGDSEEGEEKQAATTPKTKGWVLVESKAKQKRKVKVRSNGFVCLISKRREVRTEEMHRAAITL
jgi:hypothetical protein